MAQQPDPPRYPVLRPLDATKEQFVAFWDPMYTPNDEPFYDANIGKPLDSQLITGWFKWKNGGNLSALKTESIQRYSQPEERISKDADGAAVEKYLNRPGGAIWRIFFLHLQYPEKWPIYDQHAHRAMAIMQGWPEVEIPTRDSSKVEDYLAKYVPFFHGFGGINPRQVDRALWAFGKFFKAPQNRNLLSSMPRPQ